ncbi:hypothetical protein BDZ89DRAFT_955921 [Hymenopellis radicata]|nr:hypothetical protein BDZ89DRAFT_955921 [Hymenopellis radicata]
MVGSPMVIVWKNSDSTFTLSQREATAEVQPAVVSSPPRVANLQSTLSSVRCLPHGDGETESSLRRLARMPRLFLLLM